MTKLERNILRAIKARKVQKKIKASRQKDREGK